MQITEEVYPAAEALEQIGKQTEAKVLHAMVGDSVSAVARENAVAVWMEIYKYERPKGVALLKQAEHKLDTEAAKQKLKVAVETAIKYCDVETEKSACEAAARTGVA